MTGITSIDSAVYDAAMVDGASKMQTYMKITVPLIIMTDSKKCTMPVMIAMIKGLYMTNYGAMYLAIAISIFPIIIVYCFFSKYIINGLTAGAEK